MPMDVLRGLRMRRRRPLRQIAPELFEAALRAASAREARPGGEDMLMETLRVTPGSQSALPTTLGPG